MYCPKCGTQNADDAQVCQSCGMVLSGPPAQGPVISPKTCGLAVASLILGLLSVLFSIFTAIPAIILGIVALTKIRDSGGRLQGGGLAVAGITTGGILMLTGCLMMGILMPALARVRQLAFRMTCGTNLSGIGKAMLIYANDYDDELPKPGGRGATYAPIINNWMAPDQFEAFGVNPTNGSGGQANISSCFYLLVKYAEVTPKSFVCKGDRGTTEFYLANEGDVPPDFELIDAWDFGAESWKHCSYSYHVPFSQYLLTASHEPGYAVAADRNPWISSPAGDARPFTGFAPAIAPYNAPVEKARQGNANAHQLDGQNVLFLDSHVRFEKWPYCSLEDDNIYTISPIGNKGDCYGQVPVLPAIPGNRKDSVLIHDPPASGRY